MARKSLTALVVLLLLISSQAMAQKPAAPTPETDEQHKAQRDLERKALVLLDEVIKASESFKHAENRIRLKAAAANVLWEHDEARARTLFKEAMASTIDLLDNQEASAEQQSPRMFEGPRQLRRELLEMLGTRDARLAREFLRATRQQNSEPNNMRDGMPDQLIEINLATQLAETDPKQALEIAEETLTRGFSYQLPQLLSAIREKDPEAAAKLAEEIVAKLRTEKLDSSNVARHVAVSLLGAATQTPEGEEKSPKNIKPLLEQTALRELTEMLVAEALRPSSTSPELLISLQGMLPVVEKYAPARAAQLRRKMEPLKAELEEAGVDESEVAPDWGRYRSLIEKGKVEDLLAAAPNAPEHMRDILYMQAAFKIAEGGDVTRARQILNDHVKDPGIRKTVSEQLEQQAAKGAAEEGKIEQARKIIAQLRTNEERVMALAQLATGIAAKGEKKAALELLDEAREMMPGRARNFTQLGAQLAVARSYAPLDAPRSLAILEPMVDQLNELLAAAVVLGGFITEEIIKDDEITMEPLAMISNEIFADYVGDVQALARADFERTKALADRFQRDEIKTLARLLIAQSILSPKPAVRRPRGFMSPMGVTVVSDVAAPEWPAP